MAATCICASEICDGVSNCQKCDDEINRGLLPWPMHCSCLATVISRRNAGLSQTPITTSPGLAYLVLAQNRIQSIAFFNNIFPSLLFLDLSENMIKNRKTILKLDKLINSHLWKSVYSATGIARITVSRQSSPLYFAAHITRRESIEFELRGTGKCDNASYRYTTNSWHLQQTSNSVAWYTDWSYFPYNSEHFKQYRYNYADWSSTEITDLRQMKFNFIAVWKVV